MIAVNNAYNAIIEGGGYWFEWRIRNGISGLITKENIVSGTLRYSMFDKLSIGMTVSAQLNLTLWNVDIDTEEPLIVYYRVTNGTDASNWYTKGEFYIDTMKTSPYTEYTEITAFDAMLKTETDFMPTGSYVPMTTLECAAQIADDIGVLLGSNARTWMTRNPVTLSNAPHVGVGGTTDRDMLSYIGVIYGANWAIYHDRLELLFPQYRDSETRANVGNSVTYLDRSDTEYVRRVKLWLNSDTYFLSPSDLSESNWTALGGRCIEAALPFYATQAAADFILSEYTDRSYVPYTARGVYLDPKYEINDDIIFSNEAHQFQSKIASQTLTMNALAPSDLEFQAEDLVNSYYPYISSVERETLYQFGAIQNTIENVETALDGANYREQIIYISKASGTSSVAANTTWVTNATGNQNVWTTTRPVYNSSYPVLFVATQRQSVEQSSGTTCSCTTPVKDQTTTVIDGGHITTGTIDASVVNVTNINADNIETGTLTGVTISGNTINGNTITGGTISGTTITGSTLTSTSPGGSIKIADGSIDFYQNATTTGTPFSQLSHVYNSSLDQHAIEWHTTGYTKLINEAGGQWTGDFIQFACNPSSPKLMLQIYPDNNGYHARFKTDFIEAQMAPGTDTDARGYGILDHTGSLAGDMIMTVTTMNGNKYPRRFRWRQYGIVSSTAARQTYCETYSLPTGPLDLTANASYNILTTKTSNVSLWSGTLGTTSTQIGTDAYSTYSAFVIQGRPAGANKGKATMVIPKGLVSSSEPTGTITDYWSLTDENNYVNFCIWYSGNNLFMKKRDNNGSGIIQSVYGLI